MELSSFPAEPWNLSGHAVISVGLVRGGATDAPPGTRPLTVAGRTITACAFFAYTSPSPLEYHELLVATLVRRGLRPLVHITHIWVDSTASRDGGRTLWAIPKELADFDVVPRRRYTAQGIATITVQRIGHLAARLPLRFAVAQTRAGRTVTTPVSGRVRIAAARTRWAFDPAGALAHLTGLRPVISVAISDFRLRFGPVRR